jgi:hypothetical protein
MAGIELAGGKTGLAIAKRCGVPGLFHKANF